MWRRHWQIEREMGSNRDRNRLGPCYCCCLPQHHSLVFVSPSIYFCSSCLTVPYYILSPLNILNLAKKPKTFLSEAANQPFTHRVKQPSERLRQRSCRVQGDQFTSFYSRLSIHVFKFPLFCNQEWLNDRHSRSRRRLQDHPQWLSR